MTTAIAGVVGQDTITVADEGNLVGLKANKMGNLVVQDFYTQMSIEDRVYQIRAGTIAVPLVADVLVTDAAAEMALDPAVGYVCLLSRLNVGIVLGTGGTLNSIQVKSNVGASSVGAAFVPLNCNIGGPACHATARVGAAAGGVTVPAELATTTRVHFQWGSPAAVTLGQPLEWVERCPAKIGAGNVAYVQLAATGTGFSYYANLNFIELPLEAVS